MSFAFPSVIDVLIPTHIVALNHHLSKKDDVSKHSRLVACRRDETEKK